LSEDRTLVSCWLNASLDPIIGSSHGNGQRKASFWKTIEHNYNAQKGANFPVRSLRSLEGRWSGIKEQVGKFDTYYNHVVFENRSGYVDSDKGKVVSGIERLNGEAVVSTFHSLPPLFIAMGSGFQWKADNLPLQAAF
ncbi:hypothetical protein BAE44_0013788, partial [Dichanthelium oligosanthes]